MTSEPILGETFFPKAFPKLGSRLGFGVQGLGRVRATLNPWRVFFCAQAAAPLSVQQRRSLCRGDMRSLLLPLLCLA